MLQCLFLNFTEDFYDNYYLKHNYKKHSKNKNIIN